MVATSPVNPGPLTGYGIGQSPETPANAKNHAGFIALAGSVIVNVLPR